MVGISLLTLLFNLQKLKISYIIFVLLFVGYGLYYKNISLFIISQFKSISKSMKEVDSVNQLYLYFKALVLLLISIFIPVVAFILFNTPYDASISEVKDYADNIVDDIKDYGGNLYEKASEKVGEATSTVANTADSIKDTINTTATGVIESANDIKKDIYDQSIKIKDDVMDYVDNSEKPIKSSKE